MKRIAMLVMLLAVAARAQSGVLIPRDKQAPDPAILSLDDLQIHVVVDNGDAHVSITEVFTNHTGSIEEGTYRFALPGGATISDFAVWDGPVRIPAVILERKRAEEIYDQARLQAVDPGLLSMNERSESSLRASALFTAQIVPIPPYGTKRLELEYHERLTVSDFKQRFLLPFRPEAGQQQAVQHLHLTLELSSALPFTGVAAPGLTVTASDPHTLRGTMDRTAANLDEDFQVSWQLVPPAADQLSILTYRDPSTPLPSAAEPLASKRVATPEPGFFDAQLLVTSPQSPAAKTQAPRTAVILFDNSLSMQWDKLERSYAALEAILHSLTPTDRVNVLLFNQEVTPFQPQPVPATPAAIQQALDFVRASKLRGGTDLLRALAAGLAQSGMPGSQLILLTDGNSDRGTTILPGKIAAGYAAMWRKQPHPPKTDIFAAGDDADTSLLRQLAHNDGLLEHVLSTEQPAYKLQPFLSKLSGTPLAGLSLVPSGSATSLIYPLDDTVYPGSLAEWVGQYQPSATPLTLTVHATREGVPVTATAQTPLPASDLVHPQLPRLWAQARVAALLEQIDRDGETAAAIDEIIRLSRRYKFVTPYTSFLAVPRALLRPRVIRPGDPVLRVRTDPAITSVVALFPFGLTKELRHLAAEDDELPSHAHSHRPEDSNRLWETRFFAPPDMHDGTYAVRLILRDTHGNTYREQKTFVIASTPPTVKLQLATTRLHPGQTVELRASASASTRTLTARLAGSQAVPLRWSAAAHTNVGLITVPVDLPIGRYTLTVTAEDIAHNLGTQEVELDVLP